MATSALLWRLIADDVAQNRLRYVSGDADARNLA